MNISQTISDLQDKYQNQAAIKLNAHAEMLNIKAKIRKLEAIDKKANDKKANEVLGPTAVQDLEKIMDNIE